MMHYNSAKITAFRETAKHFNKFLPAEILSYICCKVTDLQIALL